MSGTGSWYQCTDCDQLPKAADLDRTQKHSYRSTHTSSDDNVLIITNFHRLLVYKGAVCSPVNKTHRNHKYHKKVILHSATSPNCHCVKAIQMIPVG